MTNIVGMDTGSGSGLNRPRIALMGEFSAGKSTLANLLLERRSSPVQVTATQLPPVWYSLGNGATHRITLDGERVSIPGGAWDTVSIEDTQLIEIGLEAEILHRADLIDMPGTSDPNLSIPYWKTILPQVDIVIWCTPANQAWRQSEAALWAEVPAELKSRSLLLITRMDKIRSAIDGARILQRVRQEAEGAFDAFLPISLTQAMAAGDNEKVLEQCGAAALVHFLVAKIDARAELPRAEFVPFVAAQSSAKPAAKANSAARSIPEKPTPRIVPRIVPRRVMSKRVAQS